ncbi:MAG: hypothetical protein JWL61_4970 [Gemmatimonadetes bacterium]|nr:hypothetical protein [Gemmatimonadota bacterium]
MTRIALAFLLLLAACKSSEIIPTRAHPEGEEIKCVGISEKGKRAGIDYDWSARNAFWAIVGIEIIAPPLIVLHHETYCPIADTSNVVRKAKP